MLLQVVGREKDLSLYVGAHSMSDSLSKREIKNTMRAEQKSGNITRINPALYRALSQYLLELEEAYHEAYVMKRNTRTLMLTREIDDTKKLIKSIYELRERKILHLAQDIVSGGRPSITNLIPEEKLLLLRLARVLLETRRQTTIEFHTDVEKYLDTLAREYNLEREIILPGSTKGATAPPEHEEPVSEPERKHAPAVEAEVTMVEGGKGEKTGKKEIETPIKGRKPEKVTERQGKKAEVSDEVEASGKGSIEEGKITPGGGSSTEFTASEEKPQTEGQEASSGAAVEEIRPDFLREYAVAGTLDSIPQFRGSDLHDYRMDKGEIVTLPVRMARLLERQGKLFIIETEKI